MVAAKTKYRKGSCENCGAMTHSLKFCCDRPRQKGARFTGKDIRPDENVQELVLDYDGKRDRWNGYDVDEHDEVVMKFQMTEEERKKKKKKEEEELNSFMTEPDPTHSRYPHDAPKEKPIKLNNLGIDSDEDSDEDEKDKDKEDFLDKADTAVGGVKKDPKTRTTIRNLRIREDTAKYLRNLDINSAYYDPKSRSMRENPTPHLKPEDSLYSGDNFVRASGDVQTFANIFDYAEDKASEVHLQAAPSEAERHFKKEQKESQIQIEEKKLFLLEKYGGEQYLQKPTTIKELNQTENYVTYNIDGSINTGKEINTKTKWQEDVLLYNHTTVWGSYWEDGRWGYNCCKQLIKNSYCVGRSGIQAKEQLEQEIINSKQEKPLEKSPTKDQRKRTINSYGSSEVTEKEMEEYHMKRKRFEDPYKKQSSEII